MTGLVYRKNGRQGSRGSPGSPGRRGSPGKRFGQSVVSRIQYGLRVTLQKPAYLIECPHEISRFSVPEILG